MKKLILAAAGASMALAPLAVAPAAAADFGHNRYAQSQQYSRHDNRGDRDNRFDNRRVVVNNRFVTNRFQNHRWQRGERFDSRYASNYMMISNPYYYHLRPAPRGYRWVRSGDDAVLIAITSGIIGAVLANQF